MVRSRGSLARGPTTLPSQVIGAQEIDDLAQTVLQEDGERRRSWRALLRKIFSGFELLPPHACGGLDMCIFVRRDVAGAVRDCSTSHVACGVGNVLKNKGAIGSFLELNRGKGKALRLLFVVA